MSTWTVVFGWSRYDSGGMTVEHVEADSEEEAIAAWLATVTRDEADDSPLLFAGKGHDLSKEHEARLKELRDAEAKKSAGAIEARERAEYERLRAKFGGGR